MNASLKQILFAAIFGIVAAPVFGQPPKVPPAKPVAAHSTFTIPATSADGRDPFFPDSLRPYEETSAAQHKLEANAFKIKGLSREHGRAMVIINNHTFAVGDEGDVLTTAGRVHLRLIEIHGNDTVIIEVNGTRRELSTVNK